MSQQYIQYPVPYSQAPPYPHDPHVPYSSSQPPPFEHHSSDQSDPYRQEAPYADEPRYAAYTGEPSTGYQANASTEKMVDRDEQVQSTERAQPGRQRSRQNPVSWAEAGPPPRSTGILRMWRKDERGKQWTRGGGFRSSLRICVCCTTITVILVISIILAILLYVRPPSVALNSVNLGNSPVTLTTGGLTVNFALNISVANPNWFNVAFKEISATAKYPIGNYQSSFGGGTLYNVDFKGYTESNFDFPFTLNYSLADDPNKAILNDLTSKCGVDGGPKEDITIDYDLYLRLKVLGVTVTPTISNSATFVCPISPSDLENIGGVGS